MRRLIGSLTLKDKVAAYKAVRHALKSGDYKPLVPSVGAGLKKDFGQVTRINFRFARHGIFLEHGVGKGRRVRSANARPKPWLAPILDPAIDELADLIAKNYLDIAEGEIKFQVPGVINKNIQLNG